ncbi:MAG: hypothetical protein ACRD1B_05935 [Thermoanaerobaculia bacterium]
MKSSAHLPKGKTELLARDVRPDSIPASEAWLFRNKAALDAVRRGLQEMAGGKTVPAGSFARYADTHR